jgi:hypothetical protein
MVVVLPEPLGPQKAEDLARLHHQVQTVHGDEIAVALGQFLCLDDGASIGPP